MSFRLLAVRRRRNVAPHAANIDHLVRSQARHMYSAEKFWISGGPKLVLLVVAARYDRLKRRGRLSEPQKVRRKAVLDELGRDPTDPHGLPTQVFAGEAPVVDLEANRAWRRKTKRKAG